LKNERDDRTIYGAFTLLRHHTTMIEWKERSRASGLHLAISIAIAACAALLVFGLWYPYPYREISGGRELFVLLTGVDVILGPLITLAVFNRRKPVRELALDLSLVGLIQLAALGYGMWTVAVARPVHLVFELDRFRVVHAIDIPRDMLDRKPPNVEAEPWLGPTLLAVRPFHNEQEKFDATMAALDGLQLAARPDLWQPYDEAKARVLAAAKPVERLKRQFPARAAEIDAMVGKVGGDPAKALYLPVVARKSFWTVFLDPQTATVIGFAPLDSF
jgi:hypothetical protein